MDSLLWILRSSHQALCCSLSGHPAEAASVLFVHDSHQGSAAAELNQACLQMEHLYPPMAAIDRRECINITFIKSLNERNFQFSQWKSGYSRTTAQFNAAKVKDAKRSERTLGGSLRCIAVATAGLKEATFFASAACSCLYDCLPCLRVCQRHICLSA